MTDVREVIKGSFFSDCGWHPHQMIADFCPQCDGRVDDILAALKAAGLVVVPREPTEKMLIAADHGTLGVVGKSVTFMRKAVWRAMVEAETDE